jgi:hypothetical protein
MDPDRSNIIEREPLRNANGKKFDDDDEDIKCGFWILRSNKLQWYEHFTNSECLISCYVHFQLCQQESFHLCVHFVCYALYGWWCLHKWNNFNSRKAVQVIKFRHRHYLCSRGFDKWSYCSSHSVLHVAGPLSKMDLFWLDPPRRFFVSSKVFAT